MNTVVMNSSAPKKNVKNRSIRTRIIGLGLVGFFLASWINLSRRVSQASELYSIPSTEQCTSCRPDSIRREIFYPRQFFERGPGLPYLSQLLHNQNNVTTPRVLNTRILLFDHSSKCQVLYFHIHKNGGTTLERHIPLPVDNFYSKREEKMGRAAFEKRCSSIMNDIYRSQQDPFASNCKFWSFTFLRDPVPRFLSGLTQTLKLRSDHRQLYPCYELETTGNLVNCVLDKLETGTFPEMHLAPQSFELYKQTMGYDIGIDVLDMVDSFSLVLRHLGVQKQTRKERSVSGSLIRRFPKFRLTLDVLTPQMIARICQIYESDVLMLKQSGVVNTTCLQAI